jgi:hypothetical protein
MKFKAVRCVFSILVLLGCLVLWTKNLWKIFNGTQIYYSQVHVPGISSDDEAKISPLDVAGPSDIGNQGFGNEKANIGKLGRH